MESAESKSNILVSAMAATKAVQAAEQALGLNHPDVAAGLNNLGMVCYGREQFTKAEPLHKRALTIREKAFGPDHLDVAQNLNNLGILYGGPAAARQSRAGLTTRARHQDRDPRSWSSQRSDQPGQLSSTV
jgi:uncharacterized protein HemY